MPAWIITISLLILPVTSLFGGAVLTWDQSLRLGLIAVGLNYLFFKNSRAVSRRQLVEKPYAGGIIALVYAFLISQFDPGQLLETDGLENWFFIISSAVVITAFVGTIFRVRRKVKGGLLPFSRVDTYVALGCGALIMISVVTQLGPMDQKLAWNIAKVIQYAMLYYVTTRNMDLFGFEQGSHLTRIHGLLGRRIVPHTVLVVLGLLVVLGGYRVVRVLNHYYLAQRQFRAGDYVSCAETYRQADAMNIVGLRFPFQAEYEGLAAALKDADRFDLAAFFVQKAVDLWKEDDPKQHAQHLEDLYFELGDLHIQEGAYAEARGAFDQAARVRLHYLDTLQRLSQAYDTPESRAQVEAIWGASFYVTLEDFEGKNSYLRHWAGDGQHSAVSQSKAGGEAYRGSRAEQLELRYAEKGTWDYWSIDANLPLDRPYGIRIYAKADEPAWLDLVVNVDYAGQSTGVYSAGSRLVGSDWSALTIENVYEAVMAHSGREFPAPGSPPFRITKIGVNTGGVDCIIYLDEIQVCMECL